eukprot:gnl/TRDRNA2_/TRDRNA2_176024_c0_seq1.p1 gnl/TRDRNA2_/TRDRNA2_176024_c0~~gnl/TRDRNA2_/TRDRNA2_176024_c0_seq1.p1  ORF type:complete len:276 (+),score=4.90 gnl/TRDRNA2_/TRDRNA2_176024_c0_seq1:526-1353(+)
MPIISWVGTKKRYRAAATNMFKNAGPAITTWLEWHIARGIEHFFLYDNLSDEQDKQFTLPYEKRGIVTRIDWPFCCGGSRDNNQAQRGQMNHALYKFGQVTDWLISLDLDEFISIGDQNINELLATASPDTNIVGMRSMLMQPGCDSFHNNFTFFGSVPVATDCPPQMTSRPFPGKYFVRTIGAYKAGLVESTPHPHGKESNVMHVNHFRDTYSVHHRTETILPKSDPLVKRFELDWHSFMNSWKHSDRIWHSFTVPFHTRGNTVPHRGSWHIVQ